MGLIYERFEGGFGWGERAWGQQLGVVRLKNELWSGPTRPYNLQRTKTPPTLASRCAEEQPHIFLSGKGLNAVVSGILAEQSISSIWAEQSISGV